MIPDRQWQQDMIGSVEAAHQANLIGPSEVLPKPKNSLIGKTVVVYDRYHFALPLKGRIQDISEKDGAFKVSFYSKQHGYPNYLKMDHSYFFSEQCHVIDNDPQPAQPAQPPHVWKHGDVFKYSSGAVMIYIRLKDGASVYCLRSGSGLYRGDKNYHPSRAGDLSYLHEEVEHLFNIKDKLGDS